MSAETIEELVDEVVSERPRVGMIFEDELEPLMKLGCNIRVAQVPGLPTNSFFYALRLLISLLVNAFSWIKLCCFRKNLPLKMDKLRAACAMPKFFRLVRSRVKRIFSRTPRQLIFLADTAG